MPTWPFSHHAFVGDANVGERRVRHAARVAVEGVGREEDAEREARRRRVQRERAGREGSEGRHERGAPGNVRRRRAEALDDEGAAIGGR